MFEINEFMNQFQTFITSTTIKKSRKISTQFLLQGRLSNYYKRSIRANSPFTERQTTQRNKRSEQHLKGYPQEMQVEPMALFFPYSEMFLNHFLG